MIYGKGLGKRKDLKQSAPRKSAEDAEKQNLTAGN
jgi:hypothetical protein